jgi:hypothetical protein
MPDLRLQLLWESRIARRLSHWAIGVCIVQRTDTSDWLPVRACPWWAQNPYLESHVGGQVGTLY